MTMDADQFTRRTMIRSAIAASIVSVASAVGAGVVNAQSGPGEGRADGVKPKPKQIGIVLFDEFETLDGCCQSNCT